MTRSSTLAALALAALACPASLLADFSLVARFGTTTYPGTATPLTGELRSYALHNGGVLLSTRTTVSTTNRFSLLQFKDGTLSVALNEVGGFPGGGDIYAMDLAGDSTVAYAVPRKVAGTFYTQAALVRFDAGVATTVVANSDTLINRGTLTFTGFDQPTVANGIAAFAGRAGNFVHFLFRSQAGTTTLVAQESVTTQPNGTGTSRFSRFGLTPTLSPNGAKLFFYGYNSAATSSADYRAGLYVEEAGIISRVFDNTTDVPGTAVKFNPDAADPLVFSADSSQTIVRAGNTFYSSASATNRYGLYRYTAGSLVPIVDSATPVDGGTLGNIGYNGTGVTNDGTVFFSATSGNRYHIYRASNGVVEIFQRGDGTAFNSISKVWLHGSHLYYLAFNASFHRLLLRHSTAGGAPVEVINFDTHPLFTSMGASTLDDLKFAGDRVLLALSAFFGGVSGPVLVQGALTDVDGSQAVASRPRSQAVAANYSATFTTTSGGTGATYQWLRNGAALSGATSASHTVSTMQPAGTGIYTAAITASGVTTEEHAILALNTSSKVIGTGTEVGPNITHANGNRYDQLLLTGAAASLTADAGQVTRISFIDANDDIVQVEFAGAGTLSLSLDSASAPAAPVKYNQAVNYVKGHASIVVTGADHTTNLSVFTVGKSNAVNQTLFRDDVTYDGVADIAYIAILSANGKFGGLRTANTSFFATRGLTGVYAPGVQFTGPLFVGDINAFDSATPVLMIGSATGTTSINGGNLSQTNARAVQVSGLTQLTFVAGSTSHGTAQSAKTNLGRLEQNGIDVTSQVVVNPTP